MVVGMSVSTPDTSPSSTAAQDQAAPRMLTVGEVARESGAAASAIRFYEARGLFASERTSGNQRRYPEYVPCLVRVARVAQRVGMSVQEIAAVFDRLPEDPTPEEWRGLTDTFVREARRRIAELEQVLADLGSDERLCELPGAREVS